MGNDLRAQALLDLLLQANATITVAILCVIALRLPIRNAFGTEGACRLWAAPPLALLLGCAFRWPHLLARLPKLTASHWLELWGFGVAAGLLAAIMAQAAFLRQARAGRAGPAVAGLIRPRLIMPADDGRYSPDERLLIRAHERGHIARGDLTSGAAATVLQCLFWFNPLVCLAGGLFRLDQEFACDAAVIRRYPRARASYARALLKTQLARTALPFGCYWPARGAHPLEVRIGLLRPGSAGDTVTGAIHSYPCQGWPLPGHPRP